MFDETCTGAWRCPNNPTLFLNACLDAYTPGPYGPMTEEECLAMGGPAFDVTQVDTNNQTPTIAPTQQQFVSTRGAFMIVAKTRETHQDNCHQNRRNRRHHADRDVVLPNRQELRLESGGLANIGG